MAATIELNDIQIEGTEPLGFNQLKEFSLEHSGDRKTFELEATIFDIALGFEIYSGLMRKNGICNLYIYNRKGMLAWSAVLNGFVDRESPSNNPPENDNIANAQYLMPTQMGELVYNEESDVWVAKYFFVFEAVTPCRNIKIIIPKGIYGGGET